MRCFITGIKGFAASYLVKELKYRDYKVAGSYRKIDIDNLDESVQLYEGDILDFKCIKSVLKDYKPDIIFHLAAFSNVQNSWRNPELCLKVNRDGTKNILEAILELGLNSKILFISSADVYGKPQKLPIREDHPIHPISPYAKSKFEAENICLKYIAKDRLNIIISRSFNHIGPKQSIGFVTSDFAKQIAYIILHKEEPVIKVGNLSAERDFTDVRDVVRAYVKLIEKCKIPDIYNICSGKAIRIMDVLNIMLDNVKEEIKIVIDEDKYRPIDVQTSYGSYKKLYNKTKWVPKISINQSIKDILKYWLSINSE